MPLPALSILSSTHLIQTPLNLYISFLGFPELIYSLLPLGIENTCYKNALFVFRAITSPSWPLCKLETDVSSRQSVLWVLRSSQRWEMVPLWETEKDTPAVLKAPVPGCKAWGAECCSILALWTSLLGPGPWETHTVECSILLPSPPFPPAKFLLNIGLHLECLSLTRPMVLILLFGHPPLGKSEASKLWTHSP